MADQPKTFDLTPEQAYKLMLAALDVVGGCSKSVSKRVRTAIAKGENTAYPSIQAKAYAALAETLDEISPGITDRLFAAKE